MIKHFKTSTLAAAIAATFISANLYTPAFAQSTESENKSEGESAELASIERIQIRGEFRAQGIEDVPASVSVLSADDIEKRHAEHLEHILAQAANVNMASGASRASFIQIRGVGERSQFVDPINASVGLVIDGINYSALGAAGTLFDIQQVEVFRGPQTTRFGVDGMAGMLYLGSTELSDYTDGLIELSAANYATFAAGVAGTLQANDDFATRLSLYQFKSDGFIENKFHQRKDTQQQDELTFRANSRWQLAPSSELLLTYHHFNIDNGYDAWSLDQDRTTLSDEPGRDTLKSHAARAQLNVEHSQAVTAQYSISALTADSIYEFDEDWAYEGIRPGWEYNSFDQYLRDRDQLEVEARWLSNQPLHLLSRPTHWVLGVYAQQRDQDLERNYTYLSDAFTSTYRTQNQAVYGELSQQFTTHLKGNFGLRYEQYNNRYEDSRQIIERPKKGGFSGRASLEYGLNQHTSVFASFAHGFKAGGVNGEALGRLEEENLEQFRDYLEEKSVFSPEKLTSVELGYRVFNPAQSLRFEATAFYSWRDDMQVNTYVEKAGTFITLLDNAAKGRNWGLETNLDYRPTDSLRLFASLGWLGTEYRGLTLQDGTDLTGRKQAHAPNYQANAGLEWLVTEPLSFRLELDHKDWFYFSNTHEEKAPARTLTHASLNYAWQQWQISLFARNIFDEWDATRGFYFGNDPRDEYTAKNYVQYGEPRRVGVSVRYRF